MNYKLSMLLTPEGLIAYSIVLIPLLLAFLFKSSTLFLAILSIVLILLADIIYWVFNWTLLLIFDPSIKIARYYGLFLLGTIIIFQNHTLYRDLIINSAIGIIILYNIYKTLTIITQ